MTNHRTRLRYAHPEAFCLMTYVADGGSPANPDDTFLVWNSRDGVTPFVIALANGGTATHHMRLARRAVDHVPAPGDLAFVDLTAERATTVATANARRWWAADTAGCRTGGRWGTQAEFRDALLADILAGLDGTPDLVEVVFVNADRTLITRGLDRTHDRIPGRDA